MSIRSELWKNILETLEDTLQLGFLEQTQYVTEVTQQGSVLLVSVSPRSGEAEHAFQFLSKPENEQRLLILAKRLERRPEKSAAQEKLAAIDSVKIVQEASGETE